ncbi:hypothetical protein [Thioalkalivibrio sp.]|uniref:hypothetical protein n=1 Tax=Thioalkalivibrio sp. TaxID=2093813 RepID=UPI003569BAA1
MRYLLHTLVLSLMLGLAAVQAQPRASIEVIDLQHRSADEIIPLIEPLLGPEDALTGTGMRLILRSGPETLAQVRQVLESVDAAPANLLISVRRGALGGALEQEAQVQGRVGRVIIGDGSGTRIISRRTTERDASVQTLRVLEGQTALIRAGESVPRVQQGPVVLPGGGLVGPEIEYRELERGFLVRPSIAGGDRVRLEIQQVHERDARGGGGRTEFQQVDTVLSGRLGEWIPIAAAGERRDLSGQRILGTRREQGDGELDIHVRVDRTP